ncbi:MAG: hypothetical protein KDA84_08765 [Planctomycetaceae bacterium]|nr:hypothetical protein [Planctomycetaceae bacterium]
MPERDFLIKLKPEGREFRGYSFVKFPFPDDSGGATDPGFPRFDFDPAKAFGGFDFPRPDGKKACQLANGFRSALSIQNDQKSFKAFEGQSQDTELEH